MLATQNRFLNVMSMLRLVFFVVKRLGNSECILAAKFDEFTSAWNE